MRKQSGLDSWGPDPIKGFAIWFVFCALLGLGVLGVAVWAVVKLVNHFAG